MSNKKRQGFAAKVTSPGMQLFYISFPFLILVFIFSYLPLHGWIYAFYQYRVGMRLADATFVGFQNFLDPFQNEILREQLVRVLRNTLAISFLGLMTTPLAALLAILLFELPSSKFRRVVQTLTTLPHFISWVIVFSLAFAMFAVDDGFVNHILVRAGLVHHGINFLAVSGPRVWFAMVGYGIWKGLGWSAIIYLAAIVSIPQELYEAAEVDGANRFRLAIHITIPGILPTFFVLLILAIANMINSGLEQFFVFQNPMNRRYIEVLDLFVFNVGIGANNIPYATAIGIARTFISTVLLFAANWLSKIVRGHTMF